MTGYQRLGKYYLFEEESKSPIRTSYRAGEVENAHLSGHVRLDVVQARLSAETTFVDQLASQNLASANLEHPNITRRLATIHGAGQLASVYEYTEGFTLKQVMDRSKEEGFPLSIDHGLLVASKIISGLAHARGKNVQHGLIAPEFVLITNEGEVKIHGFAVGNALRSLAKSNPSWLDPYEHYIPSATHAGDGSVERASVFAAGVILYEMLIGEPFYATGRDVSAAQLIESTVTAADNEPIPAPIAKILLAALDPHVEGSYRNLAQLATDMDNLIFSGEYSPTTFNLAFFMHSAFRQEIEDLTAAIKSERESTFNEAVEPPPSATSSPAEAPEVTRPDATTQPSSKKSKAPLIAGIAVAVVAIVAVALFFALRGDGTPAEDEQARLQQQQERLLAERRAEAAKAAREHQEMLEAELALLKEQIEKRNEEEAERLQQEIEGMDEKIRIAEERKRKEQEVREMQMRMAQLEQEKQDMQKRLEEQRLEEQRKAEEAQRQAEEARLAETRKKQEEARRRQEAEAAQSEPEQVAESQNTPVAEEASKPTPPVVTKPQERTTSGTATATSMNQTQPDQEMEPPEKGELVELDGYVNPPQLIDRVSYMPVPAKAIKKGHVKPGEIKTFLIRALVDENGDVIDVSIMRNPVKDLPDDYEMPEKAMKYVRKLKFEPGTKMGVKVKVWTPVGLHFKAM